MKKKLFVVLMIISLFLCACTKKEEVPEETDEVLTVEDLGTEHEKEFGGVYLKMTIDDFNKCGFSFGDSVDIVFSNGYELKDIPYYNGYYVDAGQPLLIGYPGYDYIKAAVNYGEDLWDTAQLKIELNKENSLYLKAGLQEHDTATVILREKGKYRNIQEARDITYSDDRNEFENDEQFANFRNIVMGNIREGIVYRSASPCDNQHNRATYVNDLIREAGVSYILDLADSGAKIEKYIAAEDFACDYFLFLYNDDNVYPLGLNMNYLSDEFAVKIADGFIAMSRREGPYLIHCTEGKDRTGFVCMLLEALAGADYESIRDDYMLTYDNYYKINEVRDPVKYDTILESNLDAMIRFIVSDDSVDYKKIDLSVCARNYLLKAGMQEEEIDALLVRLN